MRLLTAQERGCIDALGGGHLPEEIKRQIVVITHKYNQNPAKSDVLKRLGTAVYLGMLLSRCLFL